MKSELSQKEWKNFHNNISWIRKHYDYSKIDFAKTLNISVKTLNKIESGVLPPRLSVEFIFNIHRLFGILPKDLFKKQFKN